MSVGSAWKGHPNIPKLDILNVPSYSQKETENECMIHSIRMCLDYISDKYPDEEIRSNCYTMSHTEIMDYISVEEGTGWTPDDNELSLLSSELGAVKLEHHLERDSRPNEAFVEKVSKHLDRNVPIIAVINPKKLRRGKRASVHAVPVIGMNDEKIAFNDPWGYPYDTVERTRFINAWDDTINQFVSIHIGVKGTIGGGDYR